MGDCFSACEVKPWQVILGVKFFENGFWTCGFFSLVTCRELVERLGEPVSALLHSSAAQDPKRRRSGGATT